MGLAVLEKALSGGGMTAALRHRGRDRRCRGNVRDEFVRKKAFNAPLVTDLAAHALPASYLPPTTQYVSATNRCSPPMLASRIQGTSRRGTTAQDTEYIRTALLPLFPQRSLGQRFRLERHAGMRTGVN
eukprot:6181296-Pleurochrysis_carterae.AAC.1